MGSSPQPAPPLFCQRCGADGASSSTQGPVAPRGRLRDQGAFCQECWDRWANEAAWHDGVTDPQLPELDPEELAPYEPVACRRCNAPLYLYRTDYDRWVALEHEELPAEDVPDPHRWRLHPVPGYLIAVRVTGDEPSPAPPVHPTHRYRCADPDNRDAIPYQELRTRARAARRRSGSGEQ